MPVAAAVERVDGVVGRLLAWSRPAGCAAGPASRRPSGRRPGRGSSGPARPGSSPCRWRTAGLGDGQLQALGLRQQPVQADDLQAAVLGLRAELAGAARRGTSVMRGGQRERGHLQARVAQARRRTGRRGRGPSPRTSRCRWRNAWCYWLPASPAPPGLRSSARRSRRAIRAPERSRCT